MPVRQIDDTVKVYTRQTSGESWTLNKKLTCLNITEGYGLIQQHTARLKAITPDMKNIGADAGEQTEIDEAKEAMRYNADEEFQITNVTNFYNSITGLWCKVTKMREVPLNPGTYYEAPLFIGQIYASNFDMKNLFCDGITAYGLDVLLSHQGAVGSLCYDSALTVENFDAVPPYFNPMGRPNMGAVIDGTNAFDYSLFADFDDEANYWKPSTIIKYLLYQLNNQVIDEYPLEKRYDYFSAVTNTQLSLENANNVFTNEQKSSDYFIGDSSIWATLVQLVEVNGSYTLTIVYETVNDVDYAKIKVLEAL